jgi:signal transduction histidine kinase/ligand-binding sensor domain-containing protein
MSTVKGAGADTIFRPFALLGLIAALNAFPRINAEGQILPPLDQYRVRAYTTSDGLLLSEVNAVVQGSDGYIYVSSGRGLVRFDGYEFHRVELGGFGSDYVRYMHRDDRHDLIWLLFEYGGLGYLRGGRFTPLAEPTAVLYHQVMFAPDGASWFEASDGFYRIEGDGNASVRFLHAPVGRGRKALVPVGGQLYVGQSSGLFRVLADSLSSTGFRFDTIPSPCSALNAVSAPNGLWLSCLDGDDQWIANFDGSGFTGYRAASDEPAERLNPFAWKSPAGSLLPDPTNQVLRLGVSFDGLQRMPSAASLAMRDRTGAVWVVLRSQTEARDSLIRIDNGRIDTPPLREHLRFSQIIDMLEDAEGSIWIATDMGLLQLAPRMVFALTEEHGLAGGFTMPVIETRDGSVWVGTWGAGLHRFAQGALQRRYTADEGLPANRVRALYEAKDGTLWVGTRRGVAAITDGHVSATFRTTEARAFAETPDGRFWIGTSSQLLIRNGNALAEHAENQLHRIDIRAMHVTSDGALWIASDGGLFRVVGSTVRRFDARDGFDARAVMAISEEDNGTLWVSSYEDGLYRYREGVFTRLTTEHGLLHNGIWSVVFGGDVGVWMNSDAGVFRVDRAQLHQVADAIARDPHSEARVTPLVFTDADGLPHRESNRASPAGWRMSDGRLMFNNLDGVLIVDPALAAASRLTPRIVVRVSADGAPFAMFDNRPYVLPAGTKRVTFSFAALSFVAPSQNQYRYRLDGYDDDWIVAGNQRQATYTGLGPGRYILRAQSRNGLAPWRSSEGGVPLAVRPFVWQTWWFRLLSVVSVAAMLTIVHRYRLNRVREVERVRLRIAADLHDDVGSNLSTIALLSEMLANTSGDRQQNERHLTQIRRIAMDGVDSLRDMIWLVTPRQDGLADLLAKLHTLSADLLEGVTFTFDAPDAGGARPLDMHLTRNVVLIYKEALHNVRKHADAGTVAVNITEASQALRINIEDDGVGFNTSASGGGRGMANMYKRAQDIGGVVCIHSVPGKGTTITLRVPLTNRRPGRPRDDIAS